MAAITALISRLSYRPLRSTQSYANGAISRVLTYSLPNNRFPLHSPVLAGCLLVAAVPVAHATPAATVWTTLCILVASMLITWGAESAQFFVAQGFALAILALMQTLPEFAVEAVLAWKQQTSLLLANLTGALRLLTGLAWPAIYLTASIVHRKRTKQPLQAIDLDHHHSVEVIGLALPLMYVTFIWWKGRLELYDAAVLVVLYGAYLAILSRLAPEQHEGMEDLELIPKKIVTARPLYRTLAIFGLFGVGGAIIYFTAEPFLGSLIALATAIGIPSFIVIQWLAPVISEFPELLSTFYFARQESKAPVALMNIASSNINQWTLLVAMLPVVLSLSHGAPSSLQLDREQSSELLLTISQSVVALTILVNMRFDWWEAAAMFVLFASQFVLGSTLGGQGSRTFITIAFLGWAALEVLRMLFRRKMPEALQSFASTWRTQIRS